MNNPGRFVVLLRGVNVGKAKRVPMAQFRATLESLGHGGVRTLLNSGNAVFSNASRSSAALAAGIHTALLDALGFDVPVVVKAAREWAAAVDGNSIRVDEAQHSRLLVVFSQEPRALAALAQLAPLVQPPERFAIGGHAAYLHCAQGILASKVGAALLGKAGQALTTRNWATVLKLRELLAT